MLQDDLTLALIAVNVILTFVLVFIYFKNYRKISSKLTLGLVLFASAILVKNILDFFFYSSLIQQGITGITTFHLVGNILQLIALAFLVWVTWK